MKVNLLFSLLLVCGSLSAAPALQVTSKKSVDFGKYSANETKTARFTIKNSGDEVLIVKALRKTCGCFQLSCDRKSLRIVVRQL